MTFDLHMYHIVLGGLTIFAFYQGKPEKTWTITEDCQECGQVVQVS